MLDVILINSIKEITTTEDMQDLIEAVRAQQKKVRTAKAQNVKNTLYVGAIVDVANNRVLGRTYGNYAGQVGEIKKINRTRAVVKIEGILYNCPFGMLSVVHPKSGPVEELNGIFDPRTL